MSTEELEIIAEEPTSDTAPLSTAESAPASVADTAPSNGPDMAPSSIADLKPKMKLTGKVKRIELYGAFIDLGFDATALVHISKLGNEQVNRVSDVLNEGDEVTVWVEKVDPERGQVMLTMVAPLAVDWSDLEVGGAYKGTVTRLENFGAFVNIGAEREGLVHISELSHDYVKQPSDVVKVGDEVEVKVLGFNRRKRRIDLSMKALVEKPEVEAATYSQPSGKKQQGGGGGGRGRGKREEIPYEPYVDDEVEEMPTAMEIAMRRALGNDAVSSVKTAERKASKQQKREAQRQLQEELLNRTLQVQGEN